MERFFCEKSGVDLWKGERGNPVIAVTVEI
jgi:hypothetical protein